MNGARSAVPSAEKAAGKAENRIVIEKISQTWLASQSGPIVAAIASWSELLVPARRSRAPAPKSAPANTAYAVRDSPRASAITAGRLI